MPRLVNRKKFEAIIRRRFINVGKEHVDKMLDLLGTPPDVDNIPQAFWRGMGQELRGAIQPVLNDIYLASAEAVAESTALATGIDWTLVNTSAATWAKDYSSELVTKVTRTTKAKLRNTISDFFAEQKTVGATEAEIRKLLPDLRMKNGRILTSAQRAKLTATTEVTRASVEGERAIIGEIEADGIEMVAVWDTQNDAKVCEVCAQRDGKEQGSGWTEPPPAHPGCFCSLRYVPKSAWERGVR